MSSNKNMILARETAHVRNSIILPVTEAHRYLQSMGAEYIAKANKVTALATTMDAMAGDDKALDYLRANSNLSFTDKEFTSLNKIFPRSYFDLSEVENIFYDAIEAVENLLDVLGKLFSNGKENLKKVIMVLSDLVGKLKKTMLDTALKMYMHTKIEMIVLNQQARAA